MGETYYERLGVPADASVEEIERAYRERLKDTHPDVSDDPAAGERTRALIEARDVLTDEMERGRYDRLGHDRYVEYHESFVEPDSDDVAAADPRGSTGGPPGDGGHAGSAAGGADDWNGEATAGATGHGGPGTSNATDRTRRHAQNEQTRAAWNATGGQSGGVQGGHAAGESYAREWHAWETGSGHRVHPTDSSTMGNRLFPPGPSVILLAMAFAVYPVMLWAAVSPSFPLVINGVVLVCVVFLVAFLQSMPGVGVVVFGAWSLLLPGTLVAGLGVPVASPLVWLAVGGTVLPLGLSALTWLVLRW